MRDDLEVSDISTLLLRLEKMSLLVVDTRMNTLRFRFSEKNREYAFEKLKQADELTHARVRHLKYYCHFVQSLEPFVPIAWPNTVVDQLEQEYANIVAAIEWSVTSCQNGDDALRLVSGLPPEWILRIQAVHGRTWLDKLGYQDGMPLTDHERAKIARTLAHIAYYRGDYPQARDSFERSLALSRRSHEDAPIAATLYELGRLASRLCDLPGARDYLEESLTRCRASEDPCGTAIVLCEFGNVCYRQGETAYGRGLVENTLASLRDLGSHYWAFRARLILGDIARHEGDFVRASSMYIEAATTLIGHKILRGLLSSVELVRCYWTDVFEAIGFLAAELKLYRRAACMISAADRIRQKTQSASPPDKQRERDTYRSKARAELGDTAFDVAWAEGGALTFDQAVTYAVADEGRPECAGYKETRHYQ
jgi:non-specific serine/threonine protein kinase